MIKLVQVESIHVFLERGSSGHNGVQIVVQAKNDDPNEVYVAHLPEPFGCLIGLFLAECANLENVVGKVPEMLRSKLTHEAAGQLLATVMGDILQKISQADSAVDPTLH